MSLSSILFLVAAIPAVIAAALDRSLLALAVAFLAAAQVEW